MRRMWRRSGQPELREILKVLEGLGLLLMSIDEHLERAVILLEGGDEEADA
jgi:hypothetical protein